MSAVKIIRALLLADTDVIALVPATRISAGVLEEGTVLPAIAISEVSGIDHNILNPGASARSTNRVQVTVITATYPAQKTLIKAVRHACRDKLGTVAGFSGVAVHTDGTGPDFNDPDTRFYMQTQDFQVSFVDAT